MATWRVDRLEGMTRDDTPERIEEWLHDNGHPDAEVVSTRFNPQNGAMRLVIESEADPTDVLEGYAPTPSRRELWREQAMQDGKQVLRAIADKPRGDRTPAERALLGMAVKVAEIEDGQ